MPSVEINPQTHDRLAFAARVAGISISEVIDRLVTGDTQQAATVPPAVAVRRDAEVPVYVNYKGNRVDGLLDLDSERLRITAGVPALIGRTFKSPSQAAVEMIKAVNPARKRPETNGWRFWLDAESDQIIDHLRPGSSTPAAKPTESG